MQRGTVLEVSVPTVTAFPALPCLLHTRAWRHSRGSICFLSQSESSQGNSSSHRSLKFCLHFLLELEVFPVGFFPGGTMPALRAGDLGPPPNAHGPLLPLPTRQLPR